MRFRHLAITNTRLIGGVPRHIAFSEDKNITILLADNGFGKTTTLDALASLISPYTMQFVSGADFQLADIDVHIDRRGHRAPFLAIEGEIVSNGVCIQSARYRKGTQAAPKAKFEELKQLALAAKEAIINEDNVELPVFAYYGTGRGQFEVPARKRGFAKTYERWDAYKNALAPATDFKRFFGWFDLMEDEERREKENRRDWDYTLPVLNAVRKALTCFIKDYENPRIEMRPMRFVMDRIDEGGDKHEIRIEQMSDGYKIVIAMVADLAARMAEANPTMEHPLESDGIVLIDEVDLHLHPQWQRVILRQLHATFPNVQFIVTTHSPVIVIGAADICQVIKINGNDTATTTEDISGYNIGQVLLSELFGLQTLNAPLWDKTIEQRDNLLAKPLLTDDDRKELEMLDRELASVSVAQSDTELTKLGLLRDIAQHLNLRR